MYAAIQNAVNTVILSPIQRVRDGVRNYSAQFGRWVSAHNPARLLDTERNRAIVRGNYHDFGYPSARITLPNGGTSTCSLKKPSVANLERGCTGIWLMGNNGNPLVKRTESELVADRFAARLLKFVIPAETARDEAATDASVPGSAAEAGAEDKRST
ncbi:MAG: hypothetical protein OXC07_04455 [Kistimonas sp.]|nr:hypothetical protein [Kistimonas sp.]